MIPGDDGWRAGQRAGLLRFVAKARHPRGFGYLDTTGGLDAARPVELWITCRMTHVAALGAIACEPAGPAPEQLHDLATHGVEALRGPLRDQEYAGWHAAVDANGPLDGTKQAYGHAFVILAASSASAAGVAGARSLLDEALAVSERHFWDDRPGLVVEEWDRDWSRLDDYRGLNSNMHTVEAYLAAGDVTADDAWHDRAGRIAARVAGWAEEHDWRLPEHFDSTWQPRLDYHRDRPADPFRPYGATIGHGLEWARLLLSVAATRDGKARAGLGDAAAALYDRAVADGWSADGAEGFVYTTDWDGVPVVRSRMHWVLAEAIGAAEALRKVTGAQRYAEDLTRWWAYAERHLLDHLHGSWHHELDADNRPAGTVWPGKPDVYHAYQAALIQDLPLVPSFAVALAATLDDTSPTGWDAGSARS